jgi:hypothetical protein
MPRNKKTRPSCSARVPGRASHVTKALAMGAQRVLDENVCSYARRLWSVDQPIKYGLALGGEEDVEQVLLVLFTLRLIGYKGVDEI